TELFRELASYIDAAATATQSGVGSIPSDHPSFIGTSGIIGGPVIPKAFQEADVVLLVGCRLSSWLWDGKGPLVRGWPYQKVIQIDIQPTVIGKKTHIAVGIQGDARAVLSELLEMVKASGARVQERPWTRGLVQMYKDYRVELERLADDNDRQEGQPMHPATLAREVGRMIPHDALVVFDGGAPYFWSNDFVPVWEPRTRFFEAGTGILGFGVPYAHALKALFPERVVMNLTGDGSFGFAMQELDTARRYGLSVIHILYNNSAWGIIQAGQRMQGFELGTDLSGTSYDEIARGYGCYGERITNPNEIQPAIQRAIASGLPAVLDVKTRFAPHPTAKIFGEMGFIGLQHDVVSIPSS
ncbi:MAG: hypothetical protein K6T31_00985, partial [Alicyclobacillus sp.]|nr:hypothetical protein [Alicyclobacillus sp.]